MIGFKEGEGVGAGVGGICILYIVGKKKCEEEKNLCLSLQT